MPEKLNALVLNGERHSDLPVVGPKSAQALRDFLDSPEPPTAEQKQIEGMLVKLAIALPKAQSSEAEAHARLDIYWQALRDIPLTDLHYAFSKLVQQAKFFPTVKEILDAAAYPAAARSYRKGRARTLLLKHEREWKAPGAMIGDAERAQAADMIASASGARK